MFCYKCGKEIKGNAQFCQYCGNKTSIDNADDLNSPVKSKSNLINSKNILLKIGGAVIVVAIVVLSTFFLIRDQDKDFYDLAWGMTLEEMEAMLNKKSVEYEIEEGPFNFKDSITITFSNLDNQVFVSDIFGDRIELEFIKDYGFIDGINDCQIIYDVLDEQTSCLIGNIIINLKIESLIKANEEPMIYELKSLSQFRFNEYRLVSVQADVSSEGASININNDVLLNHEFNKKYQYVKLDGERSHSAFMFNDRTMAFVSYSDDSNTGFINYMARYNALE